LKVAERKMREPCVTCASRGIIGAVACRACRGTGCSRIRCSQCWTWKGPECFRGKRGQIVKRCDVCRDKYSGWEKKTLEEREAATDPRQRVRGDGPLRVLFNLQSGNRKTGEIPVSMTSSRTCPPGCSFLGRGCYAEQHFVAIHWRRLSHGGGMSWSEFCEVVSTLPHGQLWRHNEAGDLPGDGDAIDAAALEELLEAASGTRGFTYTHKPLEHGENASLISSAVRRGFTVNLSADSLVVADELADAGVAPVTVVLPHDAPKKGNRTPAGRHVVVCPAQLRDDISCQTCELCYVPDRKSIVGFVAHGDRKKQITERLVQLRLPGT